MNWLSWLASPTISAIEHDKINLGIEQDLCKNPLYTWLDAYRAKVFPNTYFFHNLIKSLAPFFIISKPSDFAGLLSQRPQGFNSRQEKITSAFYGYKLLKVAYPSS